MSKEQIIPISHEIKAPQLTKIQRQENSLKHLINVQKETLIPYINQIICDQIYHRTKQAKETRK